MADLVAVWESGLQAARRLGDPTGQAIAHTNIARADIQRSRLGDVRRRLHQALDLYADIDHWGGQADVQIDLSLLAERNGDNEGSLGHATQAEELYRRAGDRRGRARALNAVAWSHALLGGHAEAIPFTEQAIALHREIGDRSGEADTLDTLGYAHHHLGDHARAAECYLQAIDLFRELGDRYVEAFVLDHLGDTRLADGDRAAARAAWDEALEIHVSLGNSDAAELRAKLDGLARDAAAPG
jgi:tetratricopeptide (TPR) repeat protein